MRFFFLSAAMLAASISLSFAQSVPQQILYPDLTGNALLEQIRAAYKPASVYSYNTARDSMFSRTFNVNGLVTCVYTGDTILIPYGHATPRTIANAHVPNWSTEHVFPQSMGALTGNANSDMHHLMPVRQDANSSRSNTPFGFVSASQATIWWGPSGSQSATPSGDLSLWSRAQGSTRFEPRTAWKGDVARATFYFFTMYTDQANSGFFHGMMSELRAFHALDVVIQSEYDRTQHIGRLQGNKPNPFIIDTTLVRRIFFTNYTVPVTAQGSPDTYVADMEDATTKTGFALGTATINGQSWALGEVLIGSDANGDMRVGTKSLRFRYSQTVNTFAELVTNREQGVGTVTFEYARSNFTGDRLATAPTFILEVNTGGTWVAVGDPISLDGVDVLTTKTISVQEPGPSRIRFRVISGTNGRRFNIDNIVITPYVQETEALAIPISATEGWRMLTSPIQTTYSSLLANVWTQGASGSDAPNSPANVFTYSHAGGLQPVTDFSATLGRGQGFIYGHFNDDNYDGQPNAGPTSLTVEGGMPAGPAVITASATGGWGFVLAGNPFATSIRFSDVTKTGGAQDKIWVWDPAQNRYLNRSSGIGDYDGLIAPFQGFWLQVDGNGEFRFDRSGFTSGGTFFGKEADPHVAEFTICEQFTECESLDRLFLGFRSDAKLGLDTYDSPKLTSLDTSAITAATLIDDAPYHIQFLPTTLTAPVEIPVRVTAAQGRNLSLRIDRLHLPAGLNITIRDNLEKHSQFVITVGPEVLSTKDDGRGTMDEFSLHQNYPNPFNPSTQIRFSLPSSHVTRLTVYDILGREIAVLVDGVMPAGSQSVTFDATNITSGVYLYKLEAGGMTQVRRMVVVK